MLITLAQATSLLCDNLSSVILAVVSGSSVIFTQFLLILHQVRVLLFNVNLLFIFIQKLL